MADGLVIFAEARVFKANVGQSQGQGQSQDKKIGFKAKANDYHPC